MPCTKKIAALAAFAVPFVSAASIADLPTCALTAASSGVAATGCMATDYHCLCSATSFLTALRGEVMAKCSPGDYQATLSFAQNMCSSAGVPLNLPAPDKPSTTAAAAPQATTAAPAATPAASGANDSDQKSHTPATDAAVTASDGAGAASTSTPIIPTTTASTNGSANGTIATSEPMPFEGKAPGRRLQWASAALMVGVVGAFVAL